MKLLPPHGSNFWIRITRRNHKHNTTVISCVNKSLLSGCPATESIYVLCSIVTFQLLHVALNRDMIGQFRWESPTCHHPRSWCHSVQVCKIHSTSCIVCAWQWTQGNTKIDKVSAGDRVSFYPAPQPPWKPCPFTRIEHGFARREANLQF